MSADVKESLIWAPPGSQVTDSREDSGGRAAVLYPACFAGLVRPAGPDGIRRRGSHLKIELLRSPSLSECPRPGPTCLTHHTLRILAFLKPIVSPFSAFSQAACQAFGRQSCPLASTAQIVRANLLATAATATLYGRRLSSSVSHGQPRAASDLTIDLAPCISSVRK